MPNKSWDKLNELDRKLRNVTPPTPANEGTQLTITKISGFELFNTRAYHNYETWSDGYRIEGLGHKVEREDLDDAINDWLLKVEN